MTTIARVLRGVELDLRKILDLVGLLREFFQRSFHRGRIHHECAGDELRIIVFQR